MPERRVSASNSFTEEEVKLLDFIFSALQRGGDPRIVVRNKHFGNLSAKIIRMKKKLEEKKRKKNKPESEPE